MNAKINQLENLFITFYRKNWAKAYFPKYINK